MNKHPWEIFTANVNDMLSEIKPEEKHIASLRREDKDLTFICTNSIRWGGSKESDLKKIKKMKLIKSVRNENKSLKIEPDYRELAEGIFNFYSINKNVFDKTENKQKWIVEYSQPNTHKAFHIGHFRNVVTGDFIVRIARKFGIDVVPANYIGDIGTHVLKALLGWELAGKPKPPSIEEDPDLDLSRWLGEYYSQWAQRESASKEKFIKEAWDVKDLINENSNFEIDEKFKKFRKNKFLISKILKKSNDGFFESENFKSLNESAINWKKNLDLQNEIAERWKNKDSELVKDWKETKKWCMDAFEKIYRLLDVDFEKIYYESDVEEDAIRISNKLVNKNLAEKEGGSVLVDFKKEPYNSKKLDVLPLLRSDGLPLYSAKDLALAKLKQNQYKTDKSFYVVGAPQSFYFKQIFKILEQYEELSELIHIGYEMVDLPEGKMSSRSGNIVAFSELWQEAKKFAKSKSNQKISNKDLDKVITGALKHLMFSRDFNKKISFKWEEVLSNEGKTGSYLQYAAVRCKRVIEKSGIQPDLKFEKIKMNENEKAVIFNIFTIQNELKRSFENISPTPLLESLHRLSKAFSNFYHSSPIINEDPKTEMFRVNLTYCTLKTLEEALKIFGISIPSRM